MAETLSSNPGGPITFLLISYIKKALQGRIDPKVPLEIFHHSSHENYGLQAVDLFCWGIFRKYEKKDREWFDIFAVEKVKYEDLYLS